MSRMNSGRPRLAIRVRPTVLSRPARSPSDVRSAGIHFVARSRTASPNPASSRSWTVRRSSSNRGFKSINVRTRDLPLADKLAIASANASASPVACACSASPRPPSPSLSVATTPVSPVILVATAPMAPPATSTTGARATNPVAAAAAAPAAAISAPASRFRPPVAAVVAVPVVATVLTADAMFVANPDVSWLRLLAASAASPDSTAVAPSTARPSIDCSRSRSTSTSSVTVGAVRSAAWTACRTSRAVSRRSTSACTGRVTGRRSPDVSMASFARTGSTGSLTRVSPSCSAIILSRLLSATSLAMAFWRLRTKPFADGMIATYAVPTSTEVAVASGTTITPRLDQAEPLQAAHVLPAAHLRPRVGPSDRQGPAAPAAAALPVGAGQQVHHQRQKMVGGGPSGGVAADGRPQWRVGWQMPDQHQQPARTQLAGEEPTDAEAIVVLEGGVDGPAVLPE